MKDVKNSPAIDQPTIKETLTLIEACAYLNAERTKVLDLAGRGLLPGAQIGRGWVFRIVDVREYLRVQVESQTARRAANVPHVIVKRST
jgi:excisionase family DNA binding protein